MSKFPTVLVAMLVVAALLASCNLPFLRQNTAGVQTSAALTVQAALTSAAPVATATFTAAPFPTLPPASATMPSATSAPAVTATSNCDAADFITDVTYPDGTLVDAGSAFTKTWRFKNIGTCSWTTSYALVFKSGDAMGGPAVQALTGNVNPGQTADVSVDLTAPAGSGTYTGNWSLRNAAGVSFFTGFYVQVKVGGGGGAFAVTNVGFQVTGTCPNFHYKFTITTNGAGTVTYHRVFSDGGTDTLPGSLTFSAAGTKVGGEYDAYFGVAGGSGWTDVYIDSPNHQQFGRANYSCP